MDDCKITVAVCGDSFCAASIHDLAKTGTGRRAHFSQILEDYYGYRVLYLAHGGFGNTAIWFQIRHAIENKANVVVYNQTWSHRTTLCRNDKFYLHLGLKNFHYYDPSMQGTHDRCGGDQSAPLLNTTNINIEHSPFFSISDEQKTALDLYIKHLYSDGLQTEIDTWMFEYWHDLAQKAGVLPIYFNQPAVGKIAYDFSEANPTFDTPFHTDRATQEQIAANIHKYIVDNLPQNL
jgi:hypothetical protein